MNSIFSRLFQFVFILTAVFQVKAQTPARSAQSLLGIERGPHHRWVQTSQSPTVGTGISSSGRYALLANGLHYTNASGQWQTAVPVIQDLGDFVVCTGATYRVVLNANLNTHGAVDLETSDQRRLVSHPLGIAFYDPESGRREVLAQLKDCQAELVSSNTVVYRDAFEGSGIEASVTYAYRRGRFSQDVTFVSSPSVSPADLGMGPAARLEILTELIESPAPTRTPVVMKRETDEAKRERMVEPDLVDEKLDYGAMAMMLGRAFPSDSSKRSGIPVAKRLLDITGRTILAEAVEWRDVQAKLEELPRQAAILPKLNRQAVLKRELPKRVANGLVLPSFEARLARATSSDKPRMASLRSKAAAPRGFVLDYDLVLSAEEFTFESGQTYLVEDEVIIDGVTTFEAGAVIKYAPGAKLTIAGNVTGPGGTVVFTSKHDDSVGDPITDSTGIPYGSYADTALAFYYSSGAYLSYLDVRFAETAIYAYTGSWVISGNFLKCDVGVFAASSSISLSGDMCLVDTWYDEDDGTFSLGGFTECASDRDADGLPDNWELQYFSSLSQTGTSDYDSDGVSNYLEYLQGRNPAAGAVSDSSNQIQFKVYTPLQK